MLNMIHASNEKQTYLSENALTDLNMSFFADAEFSKNIGKFIVSDKDVIIMRQREFSDIMNNPELSIFLEELCKKITELSEVEKLRKDIEVYSDNESLLYAFRELLLFTDCIDLISGSAEKFNGKMFSEGFLSLFAYAEQIKNETWYINISKFISDTDESLRDIKSITLGINLDAKLRNQMRAEIIKLRQRINTTFVYVTHDQTEAMTLGDRIVIMRDGFIQQIGTPQEVFNHPANLFVAGFIGTPQMNFFDAKLDKDADGYYVELDGARVHLPEEKQQALRANNVEPQDITLGIRPEHIMLCSDDAAAHISATVDVSEMMGSSVHLHVNANGKDVVVIIPTIDLDGSAQQMFGYGSKVNFTFGGNVLHMFSKENEKNLI